MDYTTDVDDILFIMWNVIISLESEYYGECVSSVVVFRAKT